MIKKLCDSINNYPMIALPTPIGIDFEHALNEVQDIITQHFCGQKIRRPLDSNQNPRISLIRQLQDLLIEFDDFDCLTIELSDEKPLLSDRYFSTYDYTVPIPVTGLYYSIDLSRNHIKIYEQSISQFLAKESDRQIHLIWAICHAVSNFLLNNLKISNHRFNIQHVKDDKLSEFLICMMANVFAKYLIRRHNEYLRLQSRTNFISVKDVNISLMLFWKEYNPDDLLEILVKIVKSRRTKWNDFCEWLYIDDKFVTLVKELEEKNYPYMTKRFMKAHGIDEDVFRSKIEYGL